jgi:predicted nucleic acid-binding protein
VAACAVISGATLWTLNLRHFQDIPELSLLGDTD